MARVAQIAFFFQSLRYNNRARQPLKNRIFLLISDITSLFLIHMYIHGSSVILEIHHSCELFKFIKHSNHFTKYPVNERNRRFSLLCLHVYMYIGILPAMTWAVSLLLLAGYVHENPGPDSVRNYSLSGSSSICSAETFRNVLSIFYI